MFANEISQITKQIEPIRILIVEDDPLLQLGLEQMLSNYSCLSIVAVVNNGLQGVEKAIELKPDIVLMDIGLPGLDGITATQKIKKVVPEVEIVLLTSNMARESVQAALRNGAKGYCIKGEKTEQLLLAIFSAKEGAIYVDPKVTQFVVEKMPSPTDSLKDVHLSKRELQVLDLIAQGKSNTEMAYELYLSPHTIKSYVESLKNKLVVNARVEVVVKAVRAGLVN